jgi:hypothetical protein
MPKMHGTTIGLLTENSETVRIIANLLRVIIGMGLNNVDMLGNAEEQEHVREVDGALDMTAVRELHCPYRLQVLNQTTEIIQFSCKGLI